VLLAHDNPKVKKLVNDLRELLTGDVSALYHVLITLKLKLKEKEE